VLPFEAVGEGIPVLAAEARSDATDATVKVTSHHHHTVREKESGRGRLQQALPQFRVGARLPVAEISVDGVMRTAQVDSGCSQMHYLRAMLCLMGKEKCQCGDSRWAEAML